MFRLCWPPLMRYRPSPNKNTRGEKIDTLSINRKTVLLIRYRPLGMHVLFNAMKTYEEKKKAKRQKKKKKVCAMQRAHGHVWY